MTSVRVVLVSLLSIGLGFGAVGRGVAKEIDVDLELVLAVDVSESMDLAEQRLQRNGYVAAFRHPEVIQAITDGRFGRIAVTYFEWADQGFQAPVVPWTLISNRTDAEAFAARLAEVPLAHAGGTSISSGLFYAAGRFDNAFRGQREVVDVSGDGPNNAGRPVDATRDFLVARGITINGLPVMVSKNYSYGPFWIPNLDEYYQECVIGGPGAFMITVDDIARFEIAVRRKLVLEIAGLQPHKVPAGPATARLMPAAATLETAPQVDCQIGEKARRAWIWRDR